MQRILSCITCRGRQLSLMSVQALLPPLRGAHSVHLQSIPVRPPIAAPENRPFTARSSVGDAGASTSDAYQSPAQIRVTLAGLDGAVCSELGDILMCFGALSAAIEEDRSDGREEQKIYGSATREVWDRCRLVLLYPRDVDLDSAFHDVVETALGERPGPDRVSVEEVPAQEWQQSILESYQPIEVSPGVWMVPDWYSEEAPLPTEDPNATRLILVPGLAFGTGEHPTTRLCVTALQSLVRPGDRVLDYGTGSGILAVAALRFGAREAVGTDIDEISVSVSARNAELNGFGERYRSFLCGAESTSPEPLEGGGLARAEVAGAFDLVVANILKGPVLDLCDRLAYYVRPGGKIVISGILVTQVPDVLREYSRHFDGLTHTAQNEFAEWACVTGTRKST